MSVGVLDGVEPRSRATDPVTSVDAGRDADLSRSQAAVLDIFRTSRFAQRWGLADHTLVYLAGVAGLDFTPQRIRSARAELAKRQLVVHTPGNYVESPTGKNARVWTLAEEDN